MNRKDKLNFALARRIEALEAQLAQERERNAALAAQNDALRAENDALKSVRDDAESALTWRRQRDEYRRLWEGARFELDNNRHWAEGEQRAAREEIEREMATFRALCERIEEANQARGGMLPTTEAYLILTNEAQRIVSERYDALVQPIGALAHANPQDDSVRIVYAVRDALEVNRLIGVRTIMNQLGVLALDMQGDPAALADAILKLYEDGITNPDIALEMSLIERLCDAWPGGKPPGKPGTIYDALTHLQSAARDRLTQEQYAERARIEPRTMQKYAAIKRAIDALRTPPV